MHKQNSYLKTKGRRTDTKDVYAPSYHIQPHTDEGMTLIARTCNILIQLPEAIAGRSYRVLDRATGGTDVEIAPSADDRISEGDGTLLSSYDTIVSSAPDKEIQLECQQQGIWKTTNAVLGDPMSVSNWEQGERRFTFRVNNNFSGYYGGEGGLAIASHGDPAILVDIYVRNDTFVAGIAAGNITPSDDFNGMTISGLVRLAPNHIRFLLGGTAEAIEITDGYGTITIAAIAMVSAVEAEIEIPTAGITDSTSSLDGAHPENAPTIVIEAVNDVWNPQLEDNNWWHLIELTGVFSGLTITGVTVTGVDNEILTITTTGTSSGSGASGITFSYVAFLGAIRSNHTDLSLAGTVT